MATKAENARYEARQREAGMVRGPRITKSASEALRGLAYRFNLDPWQVVSALILEAHERSSLDTAGPVSPNVNLTARQLSAMKMHGMSAAEAREFCR